MRQGSKDITGDQTKSGSERRRHRRTPMKLNVRFLLQDGSEHNGMVQDISVGGMAIKSDAQPAEGSIVIAYVQDLGRLEGLVTRILRADGRELPCRVIDLSLGGVSVETAEWPALGEQVMVGKMRGRVVRHHEMGIAIEFTEIPPSRGSLAEQLMASERTAA